MDKRIKISIMAMRSAIQDKENLESLAFSILIKQTFVSSRINNPTYRNLRSIFGIGNSKLKCLISNGIKLGYLRYDKECLVANKLNKQGVVFDFVGSDLTASKTNSIVCKFTLKEIRNAIKKAVVVNHINNANECFDTINSANSPTNVREYRRARGKLKRMPNVKFANNQISIKRFAEISNSSMYVAKMVIRELKSKGNIVSKRSIVKTSINPEEFGCTAIKWLRETGNYGSFFCSKSNGNKAVFCKLANVYNVKSSNIILCAI